MNLPRCSMWVWALAVALLVQSLGCAAEDSVKRFARFSVGQTISYGLVEGAKVRRIEGDLFGTWRATDQTFDLAKVKLLPPTRPTKVLGAAMNYAPAPESDAPAAPKPPKPELFLKTPSCLVADGAPIILPPGANHVAYEAELVIVIGRRASRVSVAEAPKHIFGVTCGNDLTEVEWAKTDKTWWRVKGSDSFGPCGPYIVTGVNYNDLVMRLRLNGEVKTEGRTSRLIFSPAELVAYASQHMTLEPGDLIYCGAVAAPGPAKPGDRVEVEIEHVGVLRNTVNAD